MTRQRFVVSLVGLMLIFSAAGCGGASSGNRSSLSTPKAVASFGSPVGVQEVEHVLAAAGLHGYSVHPVPLHAPVSVILVASQSRPRLMTLWVSVFRKRLPAPDARVAVGFGGFPGYVIGSKPAPKRLQTKNLIIEYLARPGHFLSEVRMAIAALKREPRG